MILFLKHVLKKRKNSRLIYSQKTVELIKHGIIAEAKTLALLGWVIFLLRLRNEILTVALQVKQTRLEGEAKNLLWLVISYPD